MDVAALTLCKEKMIFILPALFWVTSYFVIRYNITCQEINITLPMEELWQRQGAMA
jgi:hypothetical protein